MLAGKSHKGKNFLSNTLPPISPFHQNFWIGLSFYNPSTFFRLTSNHLKVAKAWKFWLTFCGQFRPVSLEGWKLKVKVSLALKFRDRIEVFLKNLRKNELGLGAWEVLDEQGTEISCISISSRKNLSDIKKTWPHH